MCDEDGGTVEATRSYEVASVFYFDRSLGVKV
jgi:hypothetical protein